MHFKLQYIARPSDIRGHTFKMHDPHFNVDLVLRDRPNDEKGYVAGDGVCEATCTRSMPRLETEVQESGLLSAKRGPVVGVFRELGGAIDRLLDVMRWRCGGGRPNPIRFYYGLLWSVDGSNWALVEDTIHGEIRLGMPVKKWTDGIARSVEQLAKDGHKETLGHELQREAIACN
jgi:hypothetical protein